MQPTGQRRQRRTHHKSRLGCKTCRIRRVKCDETRPSCNRCVKFGIECEGYDTAKSLAEPRRTSSQKHVLILPRVCPTPSRQLKFGTEQEGRYFQLFCTETAKQLSGFFQETLWQTIVLQACETETPIRHAVIAIGALDTPRASRRPKKRISPDRKFAFSEYSKAVSQTRRKVASWQTEERCSERDLRTTLISCLLFAFFETLNGWSKTAITQICEGVRILEEWQLRHVQTPDEVTLTFSSKPLVIEDELLHAFSMLELEAMAASSRLDLVAETFKYSQASKINKANPDWGRSDMDRMPRSFTSLAEARVFLDMIVRRAARTWTGAKPESFAVWEPLRSHTHGMDSEYLEPDVEKRRGLGEYEQWSLAFEGLWILSRTEAGKSLFEGAIITRLNSVIAIAGRKRMAKNGAHWLARARQEPREILTLSKEFLDSIRSRGEEPGNSTFDAGIIIMLNAVGFIFRHRGMRREAINLLLKKPWREGFWDSWVTGNAMEWLADLEDEGLPNEDELEHMPEDKECPEVKFTHDDPARTTTVSCLYPLPGVEGKSVPREKVIRWL